MNWKIFDFRKSDTHVVLEAPTEKEALIAFNELKRKIPKYQDTEVWWQYSLPDPETSECGGVGTVKYDL